jgi:hypothetical protein
MQRVAQALRLGVIAHAPPRQHTHTPSTHTAPPPPPPAFPEKDPRLNTLLPRIIYCTVHFGQLLFVLNKLNAMGLLPTHASDWMASLPVPPPAAATVQAL